MYADERRCFLETADAVATAAAVKSGKVTATVAVSAALERIAVKDKAFNCFTAITASSALAAAEKIDNSIANNENPGPLAGVPFAVKNLFDIGGITTLAGSKINADNPPATQDAAVVARLKQAGAVLVGTLNMDQYAYGLVTGKSHYRPPRTRPRARRRGAPASTKPGLAPWFLSTWISTPTVL